MRCVKYSVLALISVTLTSACAAQSHLEPSFCFKQPKTTSQQAAQFNPCELALLQNYVSQLTIAFDVFHIQLPQLSALPHLPIQDRHQTMDHSSNQAFNFQANMDIDPSKLIPTIVVMRSTLNGGAQPLPLEGTKIFVDDNQQDQFDTFAKKESRNIAKVGHSVGRLEIKTIDEVGTNYFQWGTAFAIAHDVVATTCHEMESLIQHQNGEWVLALQKNEGLYLDFGERDDRFRGTKKYKIKRVVAIPDEEGLDIALLFVERPTLTPVELSPVPPPKMNESGREIVVLGYPDFHHFIDPGTEVVFDGYKLQGTAKFVSLGCATATTSVPACKKEEPGYSFTHTATTTMGESGGIVIDRLTGKVIGVHSCCSYPFEDNSSAPQGKLNCAHLKQLSIDPAVNHAISACAIFKDKTLSEVLHAHGVDRPKGCY
jgi:hypothetical protein